MKESALQHSLPSTLTPDSFLSKIQQDVIHHANETNTDPMDIALMLMESFMDDEAIEVSDALESVLLDNTEHGTG